MPTQRLIQLKSDLLTQESLIENSIKKLRSRLQSAPKGKLRISTQENIARFFHRQSPTDRNGQYTTDVELAKRLAQKGYDQKLLNYLSKQLSDIKTALKTVDKDYGVLEYKKMHRARRELVKPVRLELTDEEYARQWLSQSYSSKGFQNSSQVLTTSKGLRVRSKSEVQLINRLDDRNIPYRYEQEIYIGGHTIHPDVTCLNKRTRQEYYWEHCGMMDDLDYIDGLMWRLGLYASAGIFPGSRLILTFENLRRPLNTMQIDDVITHYLT